MKNGSDRPPFEVAGTQRQSEANEFLRDEARRAHIIGDGFLVNHLCAIAMDRVTIATAQGEPLLALKEIYWVFSVLCILVDS